MQVSLPCCVLQCYPVLLATCYAPWCSAPMAFRFLHVCINALSDHSHADAVLSSIIHYTVHLLNTRSLFQAGCLHVGHWDLTMPGPSIVGTTQSLGCMVACMGDAWRLSSTVKCAFTWICMHAPWSCCCGGYLDHGDRATAQILHCRSQLHHHCVRCSQGTKKWAPPAKKNLQAKRVATSWVERVRILEWLPTATAEGVQQISNFSSMCGTATNGLLQEPWKQLPPKQILMRTKVHR